MVSGAIKISFRNNSPEYYEKQHVDPLEGYYEWPKYYLFGFRLTKILIYQNDIDRLTKKYTIPLETNPDYKIGVMTAYLILESDNLHDGNAVRVEIDSITVGYILGNAASNFRRMIRQMNIDSHITLCKAIISERENVVRNTGGYEVYLDIPLFGQKKYHK